MLRRALCATHRDCRGKPLRVAGLIQVWECVCVCGKGKRPTHDITHFCWRVYICHNIMCVCGTTMMSLILHPLRVLDTYSRGPETVSELPKIAHST